MKRKNSSSFKPPSSKTPWRMESDKVLEWSDSEETDRKRKKPKEKAERKEKEKAPADEDLDEAPKVLKQKKVADEQELGEAMKKEEAQADEEEMDASRQRKKIKKKEKKKQKKLDKVAALNLADRRLASAQAVAEEHVEECPKGKKRPNEMEVFADEEPPDELPQKIKKKKKDTENTEVYADEEPPDELPQKIKKKKKKDVENKKADVDEKHPDDTLKRKEKNKKERQTEMEKEVHPDQELPDELPQKKKKNKKDMENNEADVDEKHPDDTLKRKEKKKERQTEMKKEASKLKGDDQAAYQSEAQASPEQDGDETGKRRKKQNRQKVQAERSADGKTSAKVEKEKEEVHAENGGKKTTKEKDIELTPEELSQIFPDLALQDLGDWMAAFAIYRECVRLVKRETGEEPQDAIPKFLEVIQHLDDSDQQKMSRILSTTVRPLSAKKEDMTLPEIVKAGHFLNVFHHHDHHNQLLEQISLDVSKPDFLIISAFCYYTGAREFVHSVVGEVNRRVDDGEYVPDAFYSDPMYFAQEMINMCVQQVRYPPEGEGNFPSIFTRRYRPMMNWDNTWRGILADGLEEKDKRKVRKRLVAKAMQLLKTFFEPIAKKAKHISEKTCYAKIFQQLQKAAHPTKEVEFHAKNLTNSVEKRLTGHDWKNTPESSMNGLGPGFRAMAHIKAGFGKTDNKLTEHDLNADLDQATHQLCQLWPWKSKVRKRHVQSLYCETQKALKIAKHGSPAANTVRANAKITTKGLQGVLVTHKKRADKKKAKLTQDAGDAAADAEAAESDDQDEHQG